MTKHAECHHGGDKLSCDRCEEVRASALKVTEFWATVDSTRGPNACWPWAGYQREGYGQFYWQGRMVSSHELAVTFTTGEGRHPDLDTCHSCDNPICCNPAHLRFDTRQGNVDDAVGRRRHAHGETNGSAKLTEVEVLTMRQRAAAGATGKQLAVDFGVSEGMATMVIRGLRWAHVGGPVRTTHGNRIHGRYAKQRKSRTPNA